MTSTFTQNLNLEEPGAGDYPGDWNLPLNSNFSLIDRALGATATYSMASGSVTLTSNQHQYLRFVLTGVLPSNVTLSLPSGVGGFWAVHNKTTGSYTVTMRTTAGGSIGVLVPQGYQIIVVSDGTNCYSATSGYVSISGDAMTGALSLPSNGLNVGAGQLQVTSGNVTGSGSLTMAGDITAYSDRRVKHSIKPICQALHKVLQLEGVTYKMEGREPLGKDHLGFIAQDAKEIVPEVVYQMEDGYYTLAYGNLTALLVEAVKELTERVRVLEADRK